VFATSINEALQAGEFAEKHDLLHFTTSAKDSTNVDGAFQALAESLVRESLKKPPTDDRDVIDLTIGKPLYWYTPYLC
jgi:hypothetical protein